MAYVISAIFLRDQYISVINLIYVFFLHIQKLSALPIPKNYPAKAGFFFRGLSQNQFKQSLNDLCGAELLSRLPTEAHRAKAG